MQGCLEQLPMSSLKEKIKLSELEYLFVLHIWKAQIGTLVNALVNGGPQRRTNLLLQPMKVEFTIQSENSPPSLGNSYFIKTNLTSNVTSSEAFHIHSR